MMRTRGVLWVLLLGMALIVVKPGFAQDEHLDETKRPAPEVLEQTIKTAKEKWEKPAAQYYSFAPAIQNMGQPTGAVCTNPETKEVIAASLVTLPGGYPAPFAVILHNELPNPLVLKKIDEKLKDFNYRRGSDRDWQKFYNAKHTKDQTAQSLVLAEIQARAAAKRDRPLAEIEKAIDDAAKDPKINSLAAPAIVDTMAAQVRANVRGTDPDLAEKRLKEAREAHEKVMKRYTALLENPKIIAFEKEEKDLTRFFQGDQARVYTDTEEKTEQGYRIHRYLPRIPLFVYISHPNSDKSEYIEFDVSKKDRAELAGNPPDRIFMKTVSGTAMFDGEEMPVIEQPFVWEHYVNGVKRTLYCY